MSLSIERIGAVQPIYAPSAVTPPYAQNPEASESVAETTAGAEAGAAAVVYEPGPADAGESHVYSNLDRASRAAGFAGDEAVVEATGGTILPPPALPETPRSARVRELLTDVWAPVHPIALGPIALDPAGANAVAKPAPQPVGQAEASAQASYAAVADAMIAGAPLAELEKFA